MAPKTKNTQKDDTATDTNAEPAVTTAAVADTSAPAADVNTGSAGDAGGEGDGTDSDPDGGDSATGPDANIDSAGNAGNGIAPGPDGGDTDSAGDAKQDETPEERMSKLTKKVASVQNGRVAVTFLGPFSRYCRGDVACFDSAVAQDMVNRNIAVWAKDAERALQPNKDDDAHDTDIG